MQVKEISEICTKRSWSFEETWFPAPSLRLIGCFSFWGCFQKIRAKLHRWYPFGNVWKGEKQNFQQVLLPFKRYLVQEERLHQKCYGY